MNIALLCVLLAALMPLLWTAIAKTTGKRFTNRNPRGWQDKLEGMPSRAHAAHLNSFEAFPVFAAGVLGALLVGVPQGTIDAVAAAFVVLRLGFGVAYLMDVHVVRSLFWFAAMACSVSLLVMAIGK